MNERNEQISKYFKECLGEEIVCKMENNEESSLDEVVKELKLRVEGIIDNAPNEIKQDLKDLYNEQNRDAYSFLEECGIDIYLSVEKEPVSYVVDNLAEMQKYQRLISEFKDLNEEVKSDFNSDRLQEVSDKIAELKQQTKFLLDNDIYKKEDEKILTDSLNNFNHLEKEVKQLISELNALKEISNDNEKSSGMEDKIIKALENECEGKFYDKKYEISPYSYDDYFDASTIINAFNEYANSKENMSEFKTFADYFSDKQYEEVFWENVSNEQASIINDLINDFKSSVEYNEIVEEYGQEEVDNCIAELQDVAYETCEKIGFEVTVDPLSFIDKNYHINLVLADKIDGTEGTGLEFKSLFSEENLNLDREDISECLDNSVTYLVQQQGYKIDEVIQEFHNQKLEKESTDNTFVKSVIDEIEDAPNYTQVTALISSGNEELMNLLDAIAHKDANKVIEISEDATIGLFDGRHNGAGGYLGIELEKTFVITADMIDYMQIEGARDREENIGYSVNSVYGLVGDAWRGEISLNDIDDTLKQELDNAKEITSETIEKVAEELENFEKEQSEEEIER